jgi:anti-sigma factor RsiW
MRRVIPFVGTTDLSAYLDGELDAARCAAVERGLAENPEMAIRFSEYQQRDAVLRQAFYELSAPMTASPPHRPRAFGWRTFAAAAACCAVLAAGLWVYTDVLSRNRELARFVHDATAAHIRYMTHAGSDLARGPAEVSAELTKLLGGDDKSPDLSAFGFHPLGVLKFADHERPAVLFVYRDSGGQLISCFFELTHGSYQTRFLRGEEAGYQISYRLTPQLDYGVVGTLPAEQLQKIADAADTGIADEPEDDQAPRLNPRVWR